MATVNKDFKIKSGLVVEGTTGTINNFDILTKKQTDQDYIVSLIGGTATSANTPDTVVKRDGSGNFAANVITTDTIYVGNSTQHGLGLNGTSTELGSDNGIVLSAGDDIALNSGNGDIVLNADGNSYLWSKSNANQIATHGYVDGEISSLDSAAQGYATNAYNDAVAAAQDYTDAEVADEVIARDAAIGVSLTSANSYADTVSGNAYTDATQYTDSAINQEVTNRNSAISTAKQEAIDAASSDATSKADAALQDANDYTDSEITALEGRSQSYADTAALTAENNAKTYADGLSSGLNWKQAVHLLYDAAIPVLSGSGANVLIIDGHAPLGDADSGYRVLITQSSNAGIYVYNSTGGSWTLTRSTDADDYSELVGAAVFVMEGTNYGSTAWVQAEHYLSSFTGQSWTQFSGQGTYLAGNGINLDGTTFSIDTAITATKSYADGVATDAEDAAKAYTDTRETAITTAYENYADGVGTSANNYTDGKIATEVTDRNDAIDSAISSEVTNRNNAIATAKSEAITDANNHADGLIADEIVDRNNAIDNAINALSTSDIEEGTRLYFTNARVENAIIDPLTLGTQTNISVTYNQGTGAYDFVAENGIADSTTDQLAEGEDNLYFTDARAINAIQLTTPNFATVEIDSVAKQVAASLEATTAGVQTAYSWNKADYRSAEFLVKVETATHSEISKVLLTLDSSDNIAITEYGIVGTNGSMSSVSASLSGSNVQLQVTTSNNNSLVTVMGTLLV